MWQYYAKFKGWQKMTVSHLMTSITRTLYSTKTQEVNIFKSMLSYIFIYLWHFWIALKAIFKTQPNEPWNVFCKIQNKNSSEMYLTLKTRESCRAITLVTRDVVQTVPSVLAGVAFTFVDVELAVYAWKPRRTGACVTIYKILKERIRIIIKDQFITKIHFKTTTQS